MVDAELPRGGVLLLGLALACQRSTAESPSRDAGPARNPAASAVEPDGAPPRLVAPSSSRAVEQGRRPSEPVGGPWVSCYANYRATSTPERDVARLSAMCGPENGMVPVGPVLKGDAADIAEDHRLEAQAGDCFRIFAVADAFVTDLGVEVVNPRGNAITWDRNGDRWPILNPDGPFCLFDAGTYTIRVRALQGKGRYALQVWRLPPAP